jgi:Ni,Fe-hydrogenase III small subunit
VRATPVLAVGDRGCTGGIFGEDYATRGKVANVIRVDAVVPGCPHPPLEILRGILGAVRRRQDHPTPGRTGTGIASSVD